MEFNLGGTADSIGIRPEAKWRKPGFVRGFLFAPKP